MRAAGTITRSAASVATNRRQASYESRPGDLQARDRPRRPDDQPDLRPRAAGVTGPSRSGRVRDGGPLADRGTTSRDRPLWATAMFGGLRRSELRALRHSDIDL